MRTTAAWFDPPYVATIGVELDPDHAARLGFAAEALFFVVELDLSQLDENYQKAIENRGHVSALAGGAVRVRLDRSKCRPRRPQ